eukprot:1923565-Pyramimonas_sp.AAC.1
MVAADGYGPAADSGPALGKNDFPIMEEYNLGEMPETYYLLCDASAKAYALKEELESRDPQPETQGAKNLPPNPHAPTIPPQKRLCLFYSYDERHSDEPKQHVIFITNQPHVQRSQFRHPWDQPNPLTNQTQEAWVYSHDEPIGPLTSTSDSFTPPPNSP